MNASTLETTVAALFAPGKGILAADESLPTIGKRFAALEISSTEENNHELKCTDAWPEGNPAETTTTRGE